MFEEMRRFNLDNLNIIPCIHVSNVPLMCVFLMFSCQLR